MRLQLCLIFIYYVFFKTDYFNFYKHLQVVEQFCASSLGIYIFSYHFYIIQIVLPLNVLPVKDTIHLLVNVKVSLRFCC